MTDAESPPATPLEPATWWTRCKAVLLDGLIFFAALIVPIIPVIVGLVVAWNGSRDEFEFNGTAIVVVVIGLVLVAAVFVWAGWLFGYRQGVTGTTPGKRRLRIRLVDVETGGAPGGARGVGRWLVPGLVGGIQGVGNVIQLVDYLWPLWDSKKQRLTDKVFRTRVVVGLPADGTDNGPEPPVSPIS
ncbi:uncharacterized protein METZ01_LOCUS320459 [marine metagenome]|uniref:RDD domain-containing protein n=1 Tax=marine metagenome TaxID=408172 RepID=A0A382P4R9_9ZZZZ